MVIRRKDGNLYVLEGPNPIVKDQVKWNPKGMVFHNFSWDESSYSIGTKRSNPPDTKTTTTQVPRAEEPEVSVTTTERPNVPEASPEPREFDLPYIKYKVLCYCLPAKVKTHVDKLYGESWQKVTYGEKFIFPCVVIESSDLSMQFWTSDPRQQVGEKSIIYPFSYEVHNKATDSYDKVPYDEYRWWRVSEKNEKEGGWLFACVPSETHPDFSG
jgi:hypothetical protein